MNLKLCVALRIDPRSLLNLEMVEGSDRGDGKRSISRCSDLKRRKPKNALDEGVRPAAVACIVARPVLHRAHLFFRILLSRLFTLQKPPLRLPRRSCGAVGAAMRAAAIARHTAADCCIRVAISGDLPGCRAGEPRRRSRHSAPHPRCPRASGHGLSPLGAEAPPEDHRAGPRQSASLPSR